MIAAVKSAAPACLRNRPGMRAAKRMYSGQLATATTQAVMSAGRKPRTTQAHSRTTATANIRAGVNSSFMGRTVRKVLRSDAC